MAATHSLEYDGLVAWVEVEKKPSQCYTPCVDLNLKDASCSIASEESKRFSVHFSASDPKCSLHLRLYLDGKRVSQKFYDINGHKTARIRFADCWTSETTVRPFIFAPLNTTDDDAYLDKMLLTDRATKIGEIKLTVNRIVNLDISHEKIPLPKKPTSSAKGVEETIPKTSKLHEKMMKGATTHHQISYGDKVDVKQKPNADGTVKRKVIHGHTKELIASFTFKYEPLSTILSRQKPLVSVPLLRVKKRSTSPSPSATVLASMPPEPFVLAPNPSVWGPPLGWDMHSHFPIPPLSLPSPIPPSLVPTGLEWPLLHSTKQNVAPMGLEDVEMKPEIGDIDANNNCVVNNDHNDEDDDDDEDEDEGEKILKVLQELVQASIQKCQETKKRKRRQAASAAAAAVSAVPAAAGTKRSSTSDSNPSPRSSKKQKREPITMPFFSSGETKEVIDLTLC